MEKQNRPEVILSADAHKTLQLDVLKRQRIEACGVLLGTIDEAGNWHVDEIYPLRNTHDSPVYFEFDPADLLAVDLAHPGRVIGAYHSHPTGLATASSTDRQNMQRVNVEEQIPWVWLIISGPFDRGPTLLQQGLRLLGLIPRSSFVAYHHYADQGLQRVSIRFVDAQEEPAI